MVENRKVAGRTTEHYIVAAPSAYSTNDDQCTCSLQAMAMLPRYSYTGSQQSRGGADDIEADVDAVHAGLCVAEGGWLRVRCSLPAPLCTLATLVSNQVFSKCHNLVGRQQCAVAVGSVVNVLSWGRTQLWQRRAEGERPRQLGSGPLNLSEEAEGQC